MHSADWRWAGGDSHPLTVVHHTPIVWGVPETGTEEKQHMADFVNPETGEIEEIPEGMDRLFWAAQRLLEAHDQIRAWEARAGMLKAALIDGQDERKAVYGDVSVSVRTALRHEFDADAFREWLADASPTAVELDALAFAAKGFAPGPETPTRMTEAIARHTHGKPTRPFIVVERVRKIAPNTPTGGTK